jgi:hypothetical protein
MRKVLLSLTLPGLALGLFLQASAAQAQATRTWVSGVGDDVNPCSRTAPCKTFAGAISKTAPGGEISVLDSGGFGALTITKSISVVAEGAEGGVLASLVNGIIINAAATDHVSLRGLIIEGAGNGLNGVRFLAGGSLSIQNCVIRGFRGASPNGFGIVFAPASGIAELHVTDTIIENNGAIVAATGGGINIKPAAGASARVALDNVRIFNNVLGFKADGVGNAGSLSTIRNSTIASNNTIGVHVVTGTTTHVNVVNTAVANNGGAGILSDGASAIVRINGTTITANNPGMTVAASGQIVSLGNNQILGNLGAEGTPTSSLPGLQ